jgi:hypothetical protein
MPPRPRPNLGSPQHVQFTYKDSGRAAVGLVVGGWYRGRLQHTALTNEGGYAGYFYPGETIRIRRGNHAFGFQAKLPADPGVSTCYPYEIEPLHWPGPLAQLRQAFAVGEPAKTRLIQRANDAIGEFLETGLWQFLTEPNYAHGHRPTTENPHQAAGALLAALAISRYFTIYAGIRKAPLPDTTIRAERTQLYAAKGGMYAIEQYVKSMGDYDQEACRECPAGGYFVRWGVPGVESRGEGDWQAEPSLDEYSGLVMGQSWLHALAPAFWVEPWSGRMQARAREVLDGIGGYLEYNNGWLARPRQYHRDFTVRGPQLCLSAWPVHLALRRFHQPTWRRETPLRWPKRPSNQLDRSLEKLDSYDHSSGLYKRYKKTLDALKTWRKAVDTIEALKWFQLVGFPLPQLAGAFKAKVVDLADRDLWKLFGEALAKNTDVGEEYNTAIFDLYSLGAYWECDSVVEEAFHLRSKRSYEKEQAGWRSLGLAAKVWFGSDFDPQEVVDRLLADGGFDRGKGHQRRAAGHVLGWSLLGLALDVEPELVWPLTLVPTGLGGWSEASPAELDPYSDFSDRVEIVPVPVPSGTWSGYPSYPPAGIPIPR